MDDTNIDQPLVITGDVEVPKKQVIMVGAANPRTQALRLATAHNQRRKPTMGGTPPEVLAFTTGSVDDDTTVTTATESAYGTMIDAARARAMAWRHAMHQKAQRTSTADVLIRRRKVRNELAHQARKRNR